MQQQEQNSFRPGYEKIVSPGRVWSERLNSSDLPFSLISTPMLLILGAVMLVSILVFIAPLEKLTEKTISYFTNKAVTTATSTKSADAAPVVFALSPSVRAVEQASELKNDVAQALVALETNNALPFTDFPSDLRKGNYEASKFSLKKVSDTTAFLAIPVGHFIKYTDESVQPAVTKYRLPDGSFVDAATPDAAKDRADSMFFAALHKENGKWVAYSFKPTYASFTVERVQGMPEVTQEMIRKSFDAAFTPSK